MDRRGGGGGGGTATAAAASSMRTPGRTTTSTTSSTSTPGKTPSKKQRSFGTKLSANSPLLLPSQQQQQQQHQHQQQHQKSHSKSSLLRSGKKKKKLLSLSSSNLVASSFVGLPPKSASKSNATTTTTTPARNKYVTATTATTATATNTTPGKSKTTPFAAKLTTPASSSGYRRRTTTRSTTTRSSSKFEIWSSTGNDDNDQTNTSNNASSSNNGGDVVYQEVKDLNNVAKEEEEKVGGVEEEKVVLLQTNTSTSTTTTPRGKNLMANFNSPSVASSKSLDSGTTNTNKKKTKKKKKGLVWTSNKGLVASKISWRKNSSKSPSSSPPTRSSTSSTTFNQGSGKLSGNNNSEEYNDGNSLAYSTIDATSFSHSPENKLSTSMVRRVVGDEEESSPSSSSFEALTPYAISRNALNQQQQQLRQFGTERGEDTTIAWSPKTKLAAAAGSGIAAFSTIVSPTSSLVSTSTNATHATNVTDATASTTATTLAASATIPSSSSSFAAAVASSMAPSEYAIQFPPGSIPLQFEPVTITAGRPTGCTIARILPEFDALQVSYIRPPSTTTTNNTNNKSHEAFSNNIQLQVNDLLVSINGIPILSRKYDISTSLLNKFQQDSKLLVFRSIENVLLWNTKSHLNFSRRTMRNIRTGKRVATALNEDVMEGYTPEEDGLLKSWVETPTQVEVRGGRQRRSLLRGQDNMIDMEDMIGANENKGGVTTTTTRTLLESINENNKAPTTSSSSSSPTNGSMTASNDKRGAVSTQLAIQVSPSNTAMSSLAMSPSTFATTPSTLGSISPTAFLFSPSNVKKIMSSSSSSSPGVASPPSHGGVATPRSNGKAGGDLAVVRTVKKSNVGRVANRFSPGSPVVDSSNSNNGSSSTSHSLTQRIGKALIGNSDTDSTGGGGEGFEHSLRLKKDVLSELKNVHLELKTLRTNVARKEDQISDMTKEMERQQLFIVESSHVLEAGVEEWKKEKLKMFQSMIGLQSKLDESTLRVQQLESLVDESKEESKQVKEANDGLKQEVLSLVSELTKVKDAADDQSRTLEGKVAILEADLTEAAEDANAKAKTVEEERARFSERETSVAEQINSLETAVAKAIEDAAAKAKVAEEEQLRSSEREASLAERVDILEEELACTREDADAKAKVMDEERLSLTEREVSLTEQMDTLEAKLATAKEDAAAKAKALEEERVERKQQTSTVSELLASFASLQNQLSAEEEDHSNEVKAFHEQISRLQEHAGAKVTDLEGKLEVATHAHNQLEGELEAANDTRVRLVDELESLKTANENAQSTIAMLKEDASATSTQLTDEISELRNAEKAAAELLNDQENKLHEAKKSNMELTEQVSSLQTANNDAVNQLALKEREITTLSGEVTKLRGCNDLLVADIASLKGNLEVEKLALQDMEHQAEQAESDIIRLTKENNASTFYIQDLQSELSDVRSSRDEHAAALKIALGEKSNLNREYDSFKSTSHKEKEELRSSIFGLEARDQQKDEQVTVLTESLTSSNDKLVDLEKEVETLSQREEFLLEHSRSLESDLAKAREDADISVKAFEAKLSALSIDLAKARNDADTASKSLDNQLQSSSQRDASRQQQVRQLDATIAALTSTVSTLTADLSRSKDDAAMASKTLQEESSSFSQRESSFAEQIHELKEEVIILESDREGTRLALENERVALASLKSEHDAVVANLQQSKEYSARLDAEKEDFIAKSNHLEATIDKLQDKNDTLSADLETATAKYNELTAQFESVTRENESSSSELSYITAKYESTTAKHEASIRQNTEKNHVLKEFIISADAKIAHFTAQVHTLTNERDELASLLKESEAKLAKAELQLERLEEEKLSFSERDAIQTEKNQCLEKNIAQLNERIKVVQSDRDDVRKKLEEKLAFISAITDDFSKAKQDFDAGRDSLMKKLDDVTSELHSAQNYAETNETKHVAKVCDLIDKLAISHNDIQQSRSLCADLKSKLQMAESLLDEGDAEIQSLSYDCERLVKQVNDLNIALENSEERLSLLNDQNESLTMELASAIASRDGIQSEQFMAIAQLKSRNESVEKELASIFASKDELLQDNKSMSELLESKQSQIASFEVKATELTKLLEDAQLSAEVNNRELQREMEAVKSDLSESKALSFVFITKLDTVNSDNRALIDSQQRLEAEVKNGEGTISQLQDEKKSLMAEVAGMKDSRDILRAEKELTEAEITRMNGKIQELTQEVESKKSSQMKQASHLNELTIMLESAQTEANENKALSSDLKSRLDSAEAQLLSTSSVMQRLSHDNVQQEKQLNELNILLENSDNDLAQQKEEKQMELATITASNNDLRRDKETMSAKLSSLNESVSELAQQLRLKDQELTSSQAEHESDLERVSQKLAKSNEEAHQSKFVADELNLRAEALENLVEEANAENDSLASDCNRLNDGIGGLRLLLVNRDDALSQHTNGNEALRQHLSNTIAEIQRLSNDKEHLAKKLESSEEANTQHKKEHLLLSAELTKMTASYQQVLQEKEMTVSELEADLVKSKSLCFQLESQCSSLRAKEAEKRSELQDLKKTFDDLTTGIRMAESQSSRQLKANETRQSELLSLIASKEAEISTLSTQKRDLTSAITKLTSQAKNAEAKSLRDTLSCEINESQLITELRDLQNAVAGSKIKRDHLASELDSAKAALGAKGSELIQAIQERESLSKEFESSVKEAKLKEAEFISKENQLSMKVRDKECQLERAEAHRIELVAKLEAVSFEHDCVTNELGSAKEAVVTLQSENENLEEKLNDAHTLYESERENLKAALGAKGSELVQAIQEKTNLAKELEWSVKEAKLKEAELITKENHLAMKVRDQERELERAEAHRTELVAKLEAVSLEYSCVKNELRLAKEAVVTLQSENENLEEKLNDAHTLYEAEREHLEEEIAASQLAMLGHKENEAMLSSDLELLQCDMSAVKQRESELRDQLEQATDALSNICEEMQDLTAERSKFEDLSKVLSNENKSLQLRLTDEISSSEVKINDLTKHLAQAEAKVGSLTGEIHAAEQRETRLSSRVQEAELLSSERQIEMNKITNELSSLVTAHEEVMSDLTGELEVSKINSEKLRSKVKEDTILHATLTKICKGKEEEIMRLQDDLELTRKEIAQIKLNAAHEEQQLLTRINDHQAIFDSQCLTLSEEKSVLAMKAERAIQAETILRSQLDSTCEKLSHLSTEVVHMQNDCASAIAEAKKSAEESVHQVVNNFEVKKGELVRDIEALNNELLKQKQRFDSELLKNDEKIQSMESCQASEMAALQQEMNKIEQARIDLFSKNIEMQSHIQQQKETNECQADAWHSKLIEANKKLDFATIELEHTKSSYEHQIQSLQDEISEKRLLNKSLSARLQVASILERRDGKLDGMINTVSKLHDACDQSRGQQSETEALKKKLKLREKSIDHLSIDLSLSQDEIISLRAEIACAKEIGLCRAFAAREETRKELDSLTEEWRSFHKCLQTLVSCMRHDQAAVPLEEALPEMTSLLNTLFDLFQMKVDEVSALQQKMREFETAIEDRSVSLVGSIGSNSTEVEDDMASLINTLEYELRDLCIQMEITHVQESSLTQSEAIKAMLQSLKMSASSNSSNGKSDPFNDSGEHQLAVGELLCEIEEAKQRVVDMSHKLESESVCRKQSDMQRLAGETALAQAEAEISTLQESLREMDEDCQIKSKELKTMELQLKEVHRKTEDLEMQIKETEGTAEMKANEAKDMESSLEQMNHQYKRSELKYERAQSEIESCQKLAVELKTKMIEKNHELESKEGIIMELQYKVDELSSRADGWKATFEGVVTDAGNEISSPEDVAGILAAKSERQDKLSSEIAQLESKIVEIEEDQRQQSSMHQAIVDGLELKCELLSEENADVCEELREKLDYISTLEEARDRLGNNLGRLQTQWEEQSRKLSDLQKASKILRQQKMDSESLNKDIMSSVKKLAGIAIVYAAKIEGCESGLQYPSTWSENLEYIAQFLDHLHMERSREEARQIISVQPQVSADATTPKSKGGSSSTSVLNLSFQHSDILEDLKNMKDAIASVMSSPKLTPTKAARQDAGNEHENFDHDKDLYLDLLKAHEQLELLSKKIEAFQHEQQEWLERESYFQDRVVELEKENMTIKSSPSEFSETEQAKMKEVGVAMMCNFNQRYRRAAMQEAVQTWNSQTRMSKHLGIAKEMAKELAITRKKVLLLKSHLDNGNQ